MMSMMTGLYPTAIGMFGQLPENIKPKHVGFPKTLDSISTLFKKKGYHTAAYSANIFFSPTYGMDQGFDEMPQVYDLPEFAQRAELSRKIARRMGHRRELNLPLITSKDLFAIYQKQPRHQESFTVFWSMDTHDPFYDRTQVDQLDTGDVEILQSAQGKREKAKLLYRDMVRFSDEQFGIFIEDLKRQGIYEQSFIILCADHGEGFGEHGVYGHTSLSYEMLIHVPLIIKFPDKQYMGHDVNVMVGLIDIVPTLVEYFELDVPYGLHGKSLLSRLRDKEAGHQTLFVYDETFDKYWRHGMVRTHDLKYIFRERIALRLKKQFRRWRKRNLFRRNLLRLVRDIAPLQTAWIFDLNTDLQEKQNLSKRHNWEPEAKRLLEEYVIQCETFFKQHVKHHNLVKRNAIVDQRLRDLGYLE